MPDFSYDYFFYCFFLVLALCFFWFIGEIFTLFRQDNIRNEESFDFLVRSQLSDLIESIKLVCLREHQLLLSYSAPESLINDVERYFDAVLASFSGERLQALSGGEALLLLRSTAKQSMLLKRYIKKVRLMLGIPSKPSDFRILHIDRVERNLINF